MPKEFQNQDGPDSDPLLGLMSHLNMPMTRDNYLELAYPEGLPEPFGPELEAELPIQFQSQQEE